MPHLSCRTCGRRVYSVAPVSSMTPDERRCPRCGTPMLEDRRGPERRTTIRRENPPNDPGPPPAETGGGGKKGAPAERPERRVGDRRASRRRGGRPPLPGDASDRGGWQD
jgi:DNA-directed RNA polymerase subunit RPC12/RpoP